MEELTIIIDVYTKNSEFELSIIKEEELKQIVEVYIDEEKKIPYKDFNEKLYEVLLEEEIIKNEKDFKYIFKLHGIAKAARKSLENFLDFKNIKYSLDY